MKRMALGLVLALALSSSACATLVGAFVSSARAAASERSDTASAPPPEEARATDSLNARRPGVTAILVGEFSTGGATKQCVYSYAGNRYLKPVPKTSFCPPTMSVLP